MLNGRAPRLRRCRRLGCFAIGRPFNRPRADAWGESAEPSRENPGALMTVGLQTDREVSASQAKARRTEVALFASGVSIKEHQLSACREWASPNATYLLSVPGRTFSSPQASML